MPEEAASAQQLTHNTHQCQCPGKAQAHEESIEERLTHVVLRSESFGAAQHNAVHHDQGDEETQAVIQCRQIGLHHHLHDGDKGGDDNNEGRDAHLVGDDALQKRNNDVRHHQHKRNKY